MTTGLIVLSGTLGLALIVLGVAYAKARERLRFYEGSIDEFRANETALRAKYEAERSLANALGAGLLKPLEDRLEQREQLARDIQAKAGTIGTVYCRVCGMILGRGLAGHTPHCAVGKAVGDWMYTRDLADTTGPHDPATAQMLEDNRALWGMGDPR